MNIIEVLVYGLPLLTFPFEDDKGSCREQASEIFKKNKVVYITEIDPPIYWAEGDYWNAEDGKQYRLAGFRCINTETRKEIGNTQLF